MQTADYYVQIQHRNGWSTGTHVDALGVLDAVEQAQVKLDPKRKGLVTHCEPWRGTCDICSTVFPTGDGCTYGCDRRAPHKFFCFACCDVLQAWDMIETGRATLYLVDGCNGKPYRVTGFATPAGCRVLHVAKSYGSAFGNRITRHDVSFVGPDGARWYGRQQGDNQLLHCRRVKVGY